MSDILIFLLAGYGVVALVPIGVSVAYFMQTWKGPEETSDEESWQWCIGACAVFFGSIIWPLVAIGFILYLPGTVILGGTRHANKTIIQPRVQALKTKWNTSQPKLTDTTGSLSIPSQAPTGAVSLE